MSLVKFSLFPATPFQNKRRRSAKPNACPCLFSHIVTNGMKYREREGGVIGSHPCTPTSSQTSPALAAEGLLRGVDHVEEAVFVALLLVDL